MNSATRPASVALRRSHRADPRKPEQASRPLPRRRWRAMNTGRPGPGLRLNAPWTCGASPAPRLCRRRCRSAPSEVDIGAVRRAAKRLARAKRPLIIRGGGAEDASAELPPCPRCCKRRCSATATRPRVCRQPRSAERHFAPRLLIYGARPMFVSLRLRHELLIELRQRAIERARDLPRRRRSAGT